MKGRAMTKAGVLGLFVFAMVMSVAVPGAWADKITIDEVVHILLLEEAKVQSIQFDVVKSPGTGEEMRGSAKWLSGGKIQQIYTEDGLGDPLPNNVKEVANEASLLEVGVDGQAGYWENAFDYLSMDMITGLRGVAIDPQIIWVFSDGKTITDEAVDNLYTIKAIGAGVEIRLDIDLVLKVVTRGETYRFGSLLSTSDAGSFALVDTIYLPSTMTVDKDVTDVEPPITFNYSNYVLNPTLQERAFTMPQ